MHKQGFTIVEVLVVTAVFALIMVAIVSFLLWTHYANVRVASDRDVNSSIAQAMDTINYEIRSAEKIYTPTTTASQLSLKTTHYLPSNETYTYVDFFLCGQAVCMKMESQDPIQLTPDSVQVTQLSFSQATNGSEQSVQTTIAAQAVNSAGNPYANSSATETSTASLRAY